MTTYKHCEKCDQTVVWKPQDPYFGKDTMKFPVLCKGGNAVHFCKHNNGQSFHEAFNCNCLNGTQKES